MSNTCRWSFDNGSGDLDLYTDGNYGHYGERYEGGTYITGSLEGNKKVTRVSFDGNGDVYGKITLPADCSHMFEGITCHIPVEYFDTSEVTNMSCMFKDCEELDWVNMNYWDFSNVTNTTEMFSGCKNLDAIYIENTPSISNVTQSTDMFKGCVKLPNFDDTTDISKFKFDNGYIEQMAGSLYIKRVLTKAYYHKWYTYYLRSDAAEGYTKYLGGRTRDSSDDTYHLFMSGIIIEDDNIVLPQDCNHIFNTSSGYVTTDTVWFTIDGSLSKFDTSHLRDMSYMFGGSAFEYCKNTELDYSSWNTSNVGYMNGSFGGFKQDWITLKGVGNLNTSKVKELRSTFFYTNVSRLDVSNWDTSNVTYMGYTFNDCKELIKFDISSWDTSNVRSMAGMFCSVAFTNIYVSSKWNTDNVIYSKYMFEYDSSLHNYNSSNPTDKTYAIIDDGTNGGYLEAGAKKILKLLDNNYVLGISNKKILIRGD